MFIPSLKGVSPEDDARMFRIVWAMLGGIIVCVLLIWGVHTIATHGDKERFFKREIRVAITSKYAPATNHHHNCQLYLNTPARTITLYVDFEQYQQARIGDSISKPLNSYDFYLLATGNHPTIKLLRQWWIQ
ncbi:MAG: hypothetical protein H7Z21_04345 [Hymenobacter sp.]|nr:hypothetical protein [Hymenobacter sp.]